MHISGLYAMRVSVVNRSMASPCVYLDVEGKGVPVSYYLLLLPIATTYCYYLLLLPIATTYYYNPMSPISRSFEVKTTLRGTAASPTLIITLALTLPTLPLTSGSHCGVWHYHSCHHAPLPRPDLTLAPNLAVTITLHLPQNHNAGIQI